MNPIHVRSEIVPLPDGSGKWQEIEIWEQAPGAHPAPSIYSERRPGKILRPLLPGEDIQALRDAGKLVMQAHADPDIWVTEE